jgi:MoaA/NifB/PqqE/SkfB family radical SAM enzyme
MNQSILPYKLDLSHLVTAFVVSSGNNPNFQSCLDALKNQTIKVNIDIIKDYNPMSVAFQQMLIRCKTPYYIEVDEDMILNNDALEILYNAIINECDKNVAMIAFQLLDVHIDFVIYGIKIYKYDIFKKYPYNLENMSCEVEQLDRMKADGYTYKLSDKIVGKHSPLWNNELIFERYLNLMEKFKEFKYGWLENMPKKLFDMFKKDPSELNLFALLGAYTSIASKDKIAIGEKDFTIKRFGFHKMQSFIEQPTSATLYITNKCNLKCDFCWRQHKDLEDFPDMTIDILDSLLFKFPTISSLCICGFGEPFLCENLRHILTYIKQPEQAWRSFGKSLFAGLITNGVLLNEKFHTIADILPDYISISLNAPNAELHEKRTKSNTFSEILKGITLSVNSGVPTYLSYVCDKQTIIYVPSFLRLAKSLGIKTVHLHNLLPHFDDNENIKFWDMVLTKNDLSLIEEIKNLPEADIVKSYPILIDKNETRRNCQFPWKIIGINGNGSITICNSVAPPKKENGLITDFIVWQNDYCQKFRDEKAGNQCDVCKKCFRNW